MPPSPAGVIFQAQAGLRRSAVRRQLRSVASGATDVLSINLEDSAVDVGSLVEEATRGAGADSQEVQRLRVGFLNSGTADRMVEQMTAKSPEQRISSARVFGALRMYDGVPWLAGLLESREHKVADAAARALGKIGGASSAAAIVTAIQRRGTNRRLVAELARSAPDLFIESAIRDGHRPSVRPSLVMAAGLRRRRAAIAPLIEVLEKGTRRERAIACRALGWIGATSAIPVIDAALMDPNWRIRMSAAKTLGSLRAIAAVNDLKYTTLDRNARVREAARLALNRLGGSLHGA